ncbi:MAG: HDIG domain-containing protein [Porphyromonas sp.]|nr:HDIG domain-containing protein [Porphyromonas sp.]
MNPIEIINKYYREGSDLYYVLMKHSTDVAECACRIARMYASREKVDLDFVYQASMLHDIGICRTYAPSIHCYGSADYVYHGILGAEILRQEGLLPHALVAERHTGTGIYPEEISSRGLRFPPDRIYYPLSVEEQIVCYADLFYSKTKLGMTKTVEQVRRSVSKWGKESLSRFEQMHTRFAIQIPESDLKDNEK